MRIASLLSIGLLLCGLWACSDADLITPTQVVVEQALEAFPEEWLTDYRDGQTYIFTNTQGEEQDWMVFRSATSWESCSGTLSGDTLYLCQLENLQLINTDFAANVQLFGRDSTFFFDPDGRQQDTAFDPAFSAFAAINGVTDYIVQYGASNPFTPWYGWDYRYGPTYPTIGSDSLRLLARPEATTQFAELILVQGEGWIFYRDTTGVEWVLDRVEN